jgi:hypothetical protein
MSRLPTRLERNRQARAELRRQRGFDIERIWAIRAALPREESDHVRQPTRLEPKQQQVGTAFFLSCRFRWRAFYLH